MEQGTGKGAASIRAEGERGTRIEADSSAALRNDKQKGLRDGKQRTAISFLAMDVSFISATLVLPAVLRALVPVGAAWRGEAVVLIKPQFEAGREHVGKGGIVREQAGRDIAIERVKQCVAEQGGTGIEVIDSPIHGMEGNWEYLLHARFGEAVEA
jgi:23S rRNA (cytidine1920-2'-O)/16S rRNA (cytidine1409-2'-O)-methyltransferase